MSSSVVAVTGLNGKPFWSWKAANSAHMWLQDWLGQDLALSGVKARLYTYGYASRVVGSSSHASPHDYALTFLEALSSARDQSILVRNPQDPA